MVRNPNHGDMEDQHIDVGQGKTDVRCTPRSQERPSPHPTRSREEERVPTTTGRKASPIEHLRPSNDKECTKNNEGTMGQTNDIG